MTNATNARDRVRGLAFNRSGIARVLDAVACGAATESPRHLSQAPTTLDADLLIQRRGHACDAMNSTTAPNSQTRPVGPEPNPLSLRVVATPDREREGELVALNQQDVLLLGRELQTEGLSLRDQRLSRIHARVAFDPRAGGYRVGDAQSRNGTFVNARRVTTAPLGDGDVIRIGDSLIVCVERDAMAELETFIGTVAPRDANVLVRGETGSGKELVARALHARSGRKGAFVPVNCASVPPELIAAELFGHTKGAFSGASAARKGMFAAAEGGTLFLDEIGDCPLPTQASLLRALQEKTFRPLGTDQELSIDVRVIAATHTALEDNIMRGAFRADLFARLSQVTLRVPPLRQRRAELARLAMEIGRDVGSAPAFRPDALEALLCWHWPFNVRELQSLLHGCLARGIGVLGVDELRELSPEPVRAWIACRSEDANVQSASQTLQPGSQRQQLNALLAEHSGNVSAVAKALGKPRAQVYRWMKGLGLSAKRFRA